MGEVVELHRAVQGEGLPADLIGAAVVKPPVEGLVAAFGRVVHHLQHGPIGLDAFQHLRLLLLGQDAAGEVHHQYLPGVVLCVLADVLPLQGQAIAEEAMVQPHRLPRRAPAVFPQEEAPGGHREQGQGHHPG